VIVFKMLALGFAVLIVALVVRMCLDRIE